MLTFLTTYLPERIIRCQTEASLRLKAFVYGKTFHCNALAGESDFNICINSDLTVSCNCQDVDGSGHIGDLKEETLDQIIHGPTASKFRALLAARKFPLTVCAHCAELRLIPRTATAMTTCHVPRKGIMVENTIRCNLRCHLCNRERLMGLRNGRHSLSMAGVEKIATILREHEIASLFYFNLGEPFIPADIYDQIKTIRSQTPNIRIITSTNGVLLDSEEKIAAALLMDYIYISLDGVDQETVCRYQVGGDFDKSYRNLVTLCQARAQSGRDAPIIEWKYVLFRWNDRPEYLIKAIEHAKSAGADLISFNLGGAPPLNKSLRWHYHPYFRSLGKKENGRIVVNLNKVPRHLLSP